MSDSWKSGVAVPPLGGKALEILVKVREAVAAQLSEERRKLAEARAGISRGE